MPPVVEVALGVEFLQLPGLGAVELVGLHDLWRSDFPKIQEQPALPPTSFAGQTGFQFKVVSTVPPIRIWMLNDGEDELLQVQNDRLLLNWRRVLGDDRKYPRYDHLRETYEKVLAMFRERVTERAVGTFQPQTAVVTYVNRFAFETGEGLKDVIAVLNPDWNLLLNASPEIRLVVPVASGAGDLIVAASTDASHGYLEVTTRINITDPEGDIFRFLDLAHESCVNGFERLTTLKMHERWGKE
jgi:uncharacterized protein (TIGR04255 family)